MGLFQNITGIGMAVTRYEIESDKIPAAFSGFKIVHLSDFHSRPKKGVVTLIKEENPDIICMTGDMTSDRVPYDSFLKLLSALKNVAPIYIISGNHDAYRCDIDKLVKACTDLGAVYLRNEYRIIEKNGEKIYLYGIDDPGTREKNILNEELKESLKSLTRHKGYEILLFHRANKLDLLENENFDLILSGHMHGGQIRIPQKGGVLAPKSSLADSDKVFFPKYSGGRYKLKNTDIIVSCGMGNPVFLPRLGNPTEIVSITLKSKNA